jgi:phage shock protein A
MGAAAHNRGNRIIAREADERMSVALLRAEREAQKDEVARLREQVATLERDLARARRCVAELRRSKDARMAEARAEHSRSDAAIRILTRVAFPGDRKPLPG